MSSETPNSGGAKSGGSSRTMLIVGVVIVAVAGFFGVQYYNNQQAEIAAQAEMAAAAEAEAAAAAAKEAEMAAEAAAKEAEMAAAAEAEKAAEMAKEAEMAAKEAADKAAEMAKDAVDGAKEAAGDAMDAAGDAVEGAKDMVEGAMESAKDTMGAAAETAMAAVGGSDATPAIIYDLGGKFDKSFNESAFNGATGWSEETGKEFVDLELQNDAQREQALRQFARRGSNPIVVPGFLWGAALDKVAPEFPDTQFAIIDMVVDQPNVRSILFKEEEGSYLVGALAAMKSETGKLGFVGGMDISLIHAFACGYAQGAMAINPDVEVYQNMTGTTPAAWNDPVTGGELAKAQFNRGADIVFHAAGGTGLGVLQAAADEGKLAIGVDSNQNHLQPGTVLTSMIKRVDVAVADTFEDGVGNTWSAGIQSLGLEQDGVGYALDEHNESLITDEMKAKVEELRAKIIAGEIVVHDYRSDDSCPV